MATATATIRHVAGPPEKWPDSDVKAGWRWDQRCLRCDFSINASDWFPLGAVVYELPDGRMTTDPPAQAGLADACRAEL